MTEYCVSTSFDEDPNLRLTMTVRATSEEAAVQSVLRYLQLEFDLPGDATYSYRAS